MLLHLEADILLAEDWDPDGLPSPNSGNIDDRRAASASAFGSKKWEVVGVDGAMKVLDAAMDGLASVPCVSAVLIVDVNVTNGDMLEVLLGTAIQDERGQVGLVLVISLVLGQM